MQEDKGESTATASTARLSSRQMVRTSSMRLRLADVLTTRRITIELQ